MQFAKAQLIPKDPGVKLIEFMFNPTELSFAKQVETSENKGARTQDKGQPKVGFSNTSSYVVTINKILFDTYETGENVVEKYIELFRKAVQFPEPGSTAGSTLPQIGTFNPGGMIRNLVSNATGKAGSKDDKQRTPLYMFAWGNNIYLRYCFVEKLSYKLTLFLPDGTPVRAVIDSLTLKEADEPKPNQDMQTPAVSQDMRQQHSLDSRRNSNGISRSQPGL
jgi:hypothetical protein